MWAYEKVFYQIYPLGMCGAPLENDGKCEHRILRVEKWIPHMKKLGIGAVYFSPVFQSDSHGYNTRDYMTIDSRLGTNEDFGDLVAQLHKNGIRVIIDGVFNHVGRGFWAFQDVLANRESSQYKDWFNINFGGDSAYNDGLWYEGWEGCYDLVKLNLKNPAVVSHLFEAVKKWVKDFDIDGIRLDVAYCLDEGFIRQLRSYTYTLKRDFFLIGEMINGDYNRIIGDGMLDSCTNYECYKGLYSSFNSLNLFEISYSLNRQFGADPWTLYRGRHLLSFADNHDVTRLASVIQDERQLPLVYAMCFGMPGIPCIYYGSEWGLKGDKKDGDSALRPEIKSPEWNSLTDSVAAMAEAHNRSEALQYGAYRSVVLTNRQCIFERKTDNERVLVAINADENAWHADFDAGCGQAEDMLTGKKHDFGGGSDLPPHSAAFWKCEK
jgi:cyclomaltodextrinase